MANSLLRVLVFVAGLCGCLAASSVDTTILLQVESPQVHESLAVPGLYLAEQEQDLEGWPSFAGDIWDTVKDSVKEVTGNLGDVSDALENGNLRGLLYNKTMETAAIVMAQSLSRALITIDNATKKLKRRTLAQKAQLLALINETRIADVLNTTLQKALSNYGKVREVLSTAGMMIGSSFERAGQAGLASFFKVQFDSAMLMVDSYVDGLQNATKDLEQLKSWQSQGEEAALPLLKMHLQRADSYLQAATASVPRFAGYMTSAFQGAVDQVLDALPEATDRVNEAFRDVTNNVSDIVFQLRSSSRELTTSAHNVVSGVAQTYNFSLPKWSVSPMPIQPPPPVLPPATPAPATPAPATPAPPAATTSLEPSVASSSSSAPTSPPTRPPRLVPGTTAPAAVEPEAPPRSGAPKAKGLGALALASLCFAH